MALLIATTLSNAGDNFERFKNAQPLEQTGSSGKLLKYVAQDQGVDKTAIEIYKQYEGIGQGEYIVKVKGAFFAYKRVGSVFSRSKNNDNNSAVASELQQRYKDSTPLVLQEGKAKGLLEYVAQDKGIEESAILIFKYYESSGQGEYVVKVNEEFYEYKRMGSVYYEAGNPPF